MTDRSITECYFSNPTEVNNFSSLNSFNCIEKQEDNDYLLHSAKKEETNLISNLEQENMGLSCGYRPRLNSNFNSGEIIQSFEKCNNFCERKEECSSFSSHKGSICSNNSALGYNNHDSFSPTENICNEKQPFGEEDSISFNDYVLPKSKAPVFFEKFSSIDDSNLKIREYEKNTPLYYSKINSSLVDFKKHSTYSFHKSNINSEVLVDSNFQNSNEYEVKSYPVDRYEVDVASRCSTPKKENKPVKTLGLHQSNSKSLQDFSKVYCNDVIEPEFSGKKHFLTSDNLEEKANLSESLESHKICTGINIVNQKSYNSNNSGNLDIAKNKCRSLPVNRNALNKAKSISLHSLQGIKKSDYSHVQSKVKSYIQNLKQTDKDKRRVGETKSLPSTPLKRSDNLETGFELHLDEKILGTLIAKKNVREDELPDSLRILKSKLLNSSENLYSKFGPDICERLFEQVKSERRQRIQQDITLNKLQLDYNNLLTKYAQAENIIDKLRIFSGSTEVGLSMRNKRDSINEPTTDLYCGLRQQSSKYHLKKAFSTSNIFHNPCGREDEFDEGSLIKYSSSPIIDPNINITIQMRQEPSDASMNFSKNKTVSLEKVNDTSTTPSFSSYNGSDTNTNSVQFVKKYDSLSQKLREFAMLEGNMALQPTERDTIWNYLKKLFNEFFDDLNSISPSLYQRQMLQNLLDGISYLSSKYNLSMTSINIPTATFSALKKDEFKVWPKTMCKTQPINHRRLSLPVEHTTFQSTLNEDNFNVSLMEKELAQDNQNDSFIDSLNKKRLVNDKLTKDTRFMQTNNNRYSCEISRPFFMQDTGKSFSSTSLKNRIAQYKAKDNDSGCPLSDRSARNSPTFSQHETSSRENLIEEDLKCLSDSTIYTSQTPVKSKKYFNLAKSYLNETNVDEVSLQTGYDASSSSADDESFSTYNSIRNKLTKQTSDFQNESSPIVKKLHQKSIRKFEDKYIYGICSSHEQDLTCPQRYRQSARNCISPIKQLEKKSSLLKPQVDGLKVKHWKQSRSKGSTLHTSRTQPIKPVCVSSVRLMSDNHDQVKANFELRKNNDKKGEDFMFDSENDIDIKYHRIVSKENQKVSSPKRKVVSKAPSNDTTFMQKKSNLTKALSLNFADLKFDTLKEKSKSISSFKSPQPMIYIEHYNCCDNYHKNHVKRKMCDNKDPHLSDCSLSNTIRKLNKQVSFLGSLHEASNLAEKIKKTSVTLLEHIREDSILKK